LPFANNGVAAHAFDIYEFTVSENSRGLHGPPPFVQRIIAVPEAGLAIGFLLQKLTPMDRRHLGSGEGAEAWLSAAKPL
jgi:hypothetical protein